MRTISFSHSISAFIEAIAGELGEDGVKIGEIILCAYLVSDNVESRLAADSTSLGMCRVNCFDCCNLVMMQMMGILAFELSSSISSSLCGIFN